MEATASVSLEDLSFLDVSGPFVSFSLESNRINSTFGAILDALKKMQLSLAAAHKKADQSAHEAVELRKQLSNLQELRNADVNRADEMEVGLRRMSETLANAVESLSKLTGSHASLERRVAAQELRNADVQTLQRTMTSTKDELEAMQAKLSRVDGDLSEEKDKTKNHSGRLRCVESLASQAQSKVTALYRAFEIDELQLVALTSDPANDRPGAPPNNFTRYCLGLPSFDSLKQQILDKLQSAEDALEQNLTAAKKKIADDLAQLRGKLSDKVDEKKFAAFQSEVNEATKKNSLLAVRLDQVVLDLNAKADKADTIQSLDHLGNTKADKADLLNFLHQEDLDPINRSLEQFGKMLESTGSKLSLELRDVKREEAAGRPRKPSVSNADLEVEKAVLGRVATLEEKTDALAENKADKKSVSDVILYVDNALAGVQAQIEGMPRRPSSAHRPKTPITEEEPKRHGLLAPLGRPTSAGAEPSRPTIPETLRPPSPLLTYTSSSPMKYIPNNAKYRATASLFDSEGRRTPASVTAPRVAADVEHWTNVARQVAGQEVIPADKTTHTIDDVPK